MHIKSTTVAYAFSVQYIENATIVAYAGLRVNILTCQGYLQLSVPTKLFHQTLT